MSQCSRQKLRTLKPTSFFQPLDLIWTFRWYSSQPVRINDTFPAHVHMFQVTTCRVLNIFGQINIYYSICCKTFKHQKISRSMVLYCKYKLWTHYGIWTVCKQCYKNRKRIKNGPNNLLKSGYMSLYLYTINLLLKIVIGKTSGIWLYK